MTRDADLLGLNEVAALFGVSSKTVHCYRREGLRLPATREEAIAWRTARRRPNGRPRKGAPLVADHLPGATKMVGRRATAIDRAEADAERWMARFRKAKAEAAELDLRERRDGMVRREDVAAMLASRVVEIRGSLVTMARRVAARFDASIRAALIEELQREVHELCERFARPPALGGETKDSRGGRRGRVIA
jgi:hypothetical protein